MGATDPNFLFCRILFEKNFPKSLKVIFATWKKKKKKCPPARPYLAGPSARKTVFFFPPPVALRLFHNVLKVHSY